MQHPCYAALIRHGDYHHQSDVPGACQPYPLNGNGRQQAQACALLLAAFSQQQGVMIAPEIHVSSLLRAWQSAKIIAHGLRSSADASAHSDSILVQTPRLVERCVGTLANLTVAQIEQVVRDDPRYADLPAGWKSNSHFCLPYPGAESLLQAGRRVADYIEQTMQVQQQRYPDGFIQLFIAHGAAFRHAAHHLGVLSLSEVSQLSMHYARPVFLHRDTSADAETNEKLRWHHHSGAWKQRSNTTQYTD
ncbi:MAG: histidine phosphatase family protein [Mariprofundus sp.]|nr:histidine phosphatase family protein [Mariprofundus sp.]